MSLIGLEPTDQLLSLEGLYERYGVPKATQELIEQFYAERYAHPTEEGWCCACEADMAFAESWLRETKPEIFRPATNE